MTAQATLLATEWQYIARSHVCAGLSHALLVQEKSIHCTSYSLFLQNRRFTPKWPILIKFVDLRQRKQNCRRKMQHTH